MIQTRPRLYIASCIRENTHSQVIFGNKKYIWLLHHIRTEGVSVCEISSIDLCEPPFQRFGQGMNTLQSPVIASGIIESIHGNFTQVRASRRIIALCLARPYILWLSMNQRVHKNRSRSPALESQERSPFFLLPQVSSFITQQEGSPHRVVRRI